MLTELCIKNLAVIEEVRLEIGKGLTIVSGDEGAGKSLVVDALGLLAGSKASVSLVRTGARSALVEAVFSGVCEDATMAEILSEAGVEVEDDGYLVLSREIKGNGRSVARANGRVVPTSLLVKLGARLLNVSRQMEDSSLPGGDYQLDLLDGFAGLHELRGRLTTKLSEWRALKRELKDMSDASSDRRRELLEFQVQEIDSANLSPGEDDALEQERHVLERAASLKQASLDAYDAVHGNDVSATGLLHRAIRGIQAVVAIDDSLSRHLDVLGFAVAEIEETARSLRCYAEAVESRSEALGEVERRIEELRRLKNKYGPGLQDVVDFGEKARQELEALTSLAESRERLSERLQTAEAETASLAEELSTARHEAARRLVRSVSQDLADVGMPWAEFEIDLTREQRPDGLPTSFGRCACNQFGIDRIEFVGATNPGDPLRPLAEVASGGESCRFMLAVKSTLRAADLVPTVVFDEIDAGIGGRSAEVIGRKLQGLAEGRQVLCVTHLPQIASFGHNHVRMVKDISSGCARSRVETLEDAARLAELAAMLGGPEKPMVESAEELLRRAGTARREGLAVGM